MQDQQILVNDNNTAGDQMYSSVTINNSGIVVVWTSQNTGGNWDLFGKWYDDARQRRAVGVPDQLDIE